MKRSLCRQALSSDKLVLGADHPSTSLWDLASGKCKSTFKDDEVDGEDEKGDALISVCELPKVRHWCTLPARDVITTRK